MSLRSLGMPTKAVVIAGIPSANHKKFIFYGFIPQDELKILLSVQTYVFPVRQKRKKAMEEYGWLAIIYQEIAPLRRAASAIVPRGDSQASRTI